MPHPDGRLLVESWAGLLDLGEPGKLRDGCDARLDFHGSNNRVRFSCRLPISLAVACECNAFSAPSAFFDERKKACCKAFVQMRQQGENRLAQLGHSEPK